MKSSADPLAFMKALKLPERAGLPSLRLNTHVHLPPNFSSLPGPRETARLARAEGVRILGLSNYYGLDVYGAFAEACVEEKIFPVFGLEMILRDEALAARKELVNDPQNPGKTYLCGKGLTRLASPVPARAQAIFQNMARFDNERAAIQFEKVNAHALARKVPIRLVARDVTRALAGRLGVAVDRVVLQERYVAEAVAQAIHDAPTNDRTAHWFALLGAEGAAREDVTAALNRVGANGNPVTDKGVQDLVRKYLLKVGRPAYVEERYISFEDARVLVTELGGVRAYPVFADGGGVPYCAFEDTPENLADRLEAWRIYAVEFIPGRNAPEVLDQYTRVLEERGFWMTAGTEHNTPGRGPIAITCKGGKAMPESCARRFLRGASILAAHQYHAARGETGLTDGLKLPRERLDEMASLGERVISAVLGPSA